MSQRSRSHKATPLRLQDPTPDGSTTSNVNDAVWDTTSLASPQAWRATSRLGVLSSQCARGRAGGTHPSIGQGRRTLTSRRPQAADSSEPTTSRTNKRLIDMSRRRLRDISRRACPRNEAPPLPVEASSFVRPLRAWGFGEPLLDRSRAHPADGPRSQHVHNMFGVFLHQPIGVFEAQQLQFNHQPCS